MRYIQCVVLAVLAVVSVEGRWTCDNLTATDRSYCSCEDVVERCSKQWIDLFCNGVTISITESPHVSVELSCNQTMNSLPSLGLDQVSELHLENCLQAMGSVRDVMDQLAIGSLERLSASGELHSLGRRQLANLADVTRVLLTGVGLTHIDPFVFGDENTPDSNITVLLLRGNNITELDKKVFSKLKHLTLFDWSFNHISTLPDDVFEHLTALGDLSLKGNRLENISSKLLRNQELLSSLDLSYNQLGHLSGEWRGLDRLATLDLSTNQLTSLGEGEESVFRHLHNLEDLDLSHNNLTRLYSDWTRLPRIRLIKLSNNNIQTFKVDTLAASNHSMQIYLHNNKITNVDIDGLSYQAAVANDTSMPEVSVYLADNPFSCDCRLLPFVSAIQSNSSILLPQVRVTFSDLDKLVCGSPSSLSNHSLAGLTLEDLTCPV